MFSTSLGEPAAAIRVSAARRRFAATLAGAVAFLIAAGALVTSKGAGLSVPDWPLSYGTLNPPGWWRLEQVRAEHGHRLIAGTIALLTLVHAIWIQRVEPRRWVRRLAWLAVAAVLAQAALGGLTVLLLLPDAISVSHAGLAQLFFALTVTLALASSRTWATLAPGSLPLAASRAVNPLARLTAAAVFLQILLGAVMRHGDAGLAIPTFPSTFGRVFPRTWTYEVTIHFAHRVGAVVVATLIVLLLLRVRRHSEHPTLSRLASLLTGLVSAQVLLGATVIWTAREVVPNTLHVLGGALVFATSLLLALVGARLGVSAPRPTGATAAVELGHGTTG